MSNPMPTPRTPDHAVDPQFPARWSPRALTGAGVAPAQVMQILEAARWAPSASNHQPWRLVWAVSGEVAFAAILGALVPFNRDWARNAGALIVVASCDTATAKDGSSVPNPTSAFDSGAAWISMALQATSMGLAAHAIAGFDPAALAAAVNLPGGHSLHAVVAIGHKGAAEDLPDHLRAREFPSPRRPLSDISAHGQF